MTKIGIADTTFARVSMADFAIGVIKKNSEHEIEKRQGKEDEGPV